MALRQTPPTWTAVTTGSDEYSIELNDANLETKAWKSSRYDGSQTVTQQLNKYSAGDTTFGKTAAVQKYSRNIYIGNTVIGMDNGGEDSLLLNYPNFSYVTTVRYITVNDDNTISDNKLESNKNNFDAKRGFYRAFNEDFPVGSDCRIILNDISTKTNLKDRYNIYFNEGQLQSFLKLNMTDAVTAAANNDSNNLYATSSISGQQPSFVNFTGFYTLDDSLGGSLFYFNYNIIRQFYKGELASIDKTDATGTNFFTPLSGAFAYKNTSNYKGDKRIFLTFTSGSDNTSIGDPIRTIETGSIPNGEEPLRTDNLGELSTIELSDILFSGTNIRLYYASTKPNPFLNQSYNHETGDPRPPIFSGGDLVFTKCEDATPSLLLNLPKNEHLPDGIGGKSFAIIPENLHPHIKRNLTHFLAKAGISLGVDTIPALDNTFETLK